ncbi:helix-turn-helix domain-containing protein (plasmid) [Methylobacterium currus]|uniref:helix-turn-helix domain-containing protein n=1 Tax=Methylobacterium currus TaxID=2051553 RepID=UPI001E2BD91B|nr:helix-turn-helix domain-containing protein [Methylobacterium currus]UHC20475.1 helix-turn-helix domain-containing protein [Methylobacterium currus]
MTQAAVRPDVMFRALGVSRGAGYRAIASGDIPSFRIGNQIRIPTAPLREKLRLAGPVAA